MYMKWLMDRLNNSEYLVLINIRINPLLREYSVQLLMKYTNNFKEYEQKMKNSRISLMFKINKYAIQFLTNCYN